MKRIFGIYDGIVHWLEGRWPMNLTLLFTRVVLAGIFWRSGQTKVVEGTWLSISDSTYLLFRNDYSGVPIPPDIAAVMATWSEHLFPILLVLGLFTRLSALALLGMTLVIQLFVYPDAWWQVHSLWVAMALVLILRGGGDLTLDRLLTAKRRA